MPSKPRVEEEYNKHDLRLDHYHKMDTSPSKPPMQTLKGKVHRNADLSYVAEELMDLQDEYGGEVRGRLDLVAESLLFHLEKKQDTVSKLQSDKRDLKAENTELKRKLKEAKKSLK